MKKLLATLTLGTLVSLPYTALAHHDPPNTARTPVVTRCFPGEEPMTWEWQVDSSQPHGGSQWSASNHSEGMPPWQPEDQSFWFTTNGNFLNLNASWIHGPFNVQLFSECDVTVVHAPPPPPDPAPHVVIEQKSEVVVEAPEPVVIEREVTVERVVEVEVTPEEPEPEEDDDVPWLMLTALFLSASALGWFLSYCWINRP